MSVGFFYWISAGIIATCFYLFFSVLYEGLLKNRSRKMHRWLAVMTSTIGVILVFIVTTVLKN